ncbi:MAG: ABC transporter ATP-binding protein [Halobacteriaceae archaeon]
MSLAVDVAAAFDAAGADRFAVEAAFEVPAGETLVVLGPSGSGKSLLLEVLAGFHPHEGTVTRDGERLDDRPPERRELGFVFQDYALFPHMTARENVAFGQRYRESRRDADALLDALGVARVADRFPPTLSGGEAQRVAVARALAVDPSVLLLDEPLSSLDPPTRQALRADLADVLADVTAVYVTHDRTTARALGDSIAVLRAGGVVQRGSPEDVFDRPASPFVARFTGSNVVTLSDGPLRDAVADGRPGDVVAVRPEHVVLGGAGPTGTVERVVREESAHRVTVALGGTRLDALTADPPAVGAGVPVAVPPGRAAVVGADDDPAAGDG